MSWIFSNLADFIQDCILGMMEVFGTFINDMYKATVILSDNYIGGGVLRFTTTLSLVLAAVMAVKHYIMVYGLHLEGDADEDPLDYLYRVGMVVALISCSSAIFDFIYNFGIGVMADITSAVQLDMSIEFDAAVNGVDKAATSGGILIIIYAVLAITLIGFSITSAFRAVELVVMKLLFPLFALDLLGGRDRFNNFSFNYIVTGGMYGFQLLLVMLFCKVFATSSGDIISLMVCFATLFFSLKAPKWLDKYLYSTGIGKMVGGVARTGLYIGMMGR